jgi:hypothetical protein
MRSYAPGNVRKKSSSELDFESAVSQRGHRLALAQQAGNGNTSLQHVQRRMGNQAALRFLGVGNEPRTGGNETLTVNEPGDAYEREADQIAERLMRTQAPTTRSISAGLGAQKSLQRKCAQCEEEEEEDRNTLKRASPERTMRRKCSHCEEEEEQSAKRLQRSETGAGPSVAPPIVQDVLRSPGQPLDSTVRAFMEPRFGRDFSAVRIHSDPKAADSARAVGARGYTVGSHIVFSRDNYAPATTQGRSLLAHELMHVVQQTGGRAGQLVQRDSKKGTPRVTPAAASPKSKATDYKNIRMHFDGADLVVTGDKEEIFRYSAQSGRPIRITPEDAAQCGASTVTDTYMNDKRFVGIKDAGPTPEGTYTFTAPSIERFTFGEEIGLITSSVTGHKETTVHGHKIHSGDWGSGRVPLSPVGRVGEGPCGNASKRDGFFLHGGLLAGSSGCIDIGTHFDELADFLEGYKQPIRLTIKYERPPPSVRFFTGLSGATAYGAFHLRQDPHLRLGAEFTPLGARGVASAGYDEVLQWAGGAIHVGARLDIPFNDKEAFVRAGLSGGVHFRIFQGLYGQLFGGYSWDIGRATQGPEVGAGLRYDLGRVHLEALYNVLHVANQNERVHQALVGVGFTFP